MTFVNLEVDLESLPRFDAPDFHRPDPRYPGVVLGLVVAFETIALIAAAAILIPAPAELASLPGGIASLGAVALAAALAWYAHKSASVIRYAVREHDVIVHKGVFFKRETIQPIRRIQHVEQTQGPVARRFGLFKIRLFSAGTAHFAFEIPGLNAETAAQLRQAILELRESKLAVASSSSGPRDGIEADASGMPSEPHG